MRQFIGGPFDGYQIPEPMPAWLDEGMVRWPVNDAMIRCLANAVGDYVPAGQFSKALQTPFKAWAVYERCEIDGTVHYRFVEEIPNNEDFNSGQM